MKSTVLIVDDNQSSREALESILSQEGYALQMAENGLQALKQADALHPDLILLDVMMPGMDGFEVCRRLRSTPGLAEVPIIMLTALDDNASRLEGIESGADDFLTKPFERQELRARVRTITRLNRYQTLLKQRESLRDMAQRMVTNLEEERMRISRELHDELGQLLTAQLLDIRELQTDLTIPPEVLFARLENIHNHAYEFAIKIRRLAHDLRPPLLSTLGLKQAFQTLCSKFSNTSHIPISVEIDESVNDLPDMYGIILYRILQEALNNIAKHANASRIWVELSREEGILSLTVQDNGIGLPVNMPANNGIGIIGMKERVSLVGGELGIRSGKNGGTILTASLPFKPEANAESEEK
jgi:signal transduction histidine kinase